ncbi:hypothetical protein [Nocardioides psychrotolerans]|uniref:Uncharacterized protein n=1 Tax=Nocardioides psychrotolerans TaxID=1005945 RepID=A0A1I3LMH4_9ACTN|nr:hypothetical protein [Nocardioides psychrotolerans]SFI85912.1 hypothetical protein SAMN05216561_11429 [Nocardioides psychrotolerans]
MTRQSKTPHQRAEEALGVAQRRVERIDQALAHQRSLLATYEADLADAQARLDYARQDPALPTTSTGATA